ncbi:MAG: DUF503 domain-containing protein [Candidatus Omnitrophota bacterium]
MVIGVLTVALHIPVSNSLKEKRRVVSGLKSRMAAAFNVSVAEVDAQDQWQKAVLAFVHVGVSKPVVNSALDRMRAYVEAYHAASLLDYEMELIA